MKPTTPSAIPPIARKHWLTPLIVILLTMPLWLGAFEPAVFYFFNHHLAVVPDQIWAVLSLLGTGWVVFALTAPALLRSPRILLAWLCAAPVAGLLTRAGKSFMETPRPLELLDAQTIHLIGEPLFIAAMPSGHTITAFAAVTAIYLSLAQHTRRRYIWLFALALGVGLSRVAVGAHWPADVAVGAALGLFSGVIGAWMCRMIRPQYLRPQSWLVRAAAVFGLYCMHVLLNDAMGFAQNMPVQYVLAAFLALNLTLFSVVTVRAPNLERETKAGDSTP